MNQATDMTEKKRKVYPMNSIVGGTFLGGPLAAGYLISENFKTLDQKEKVLPTWAITVAASMVIFGSIFLIPDSVKIPNQLIPLIYTAIVYFIVNKIQGDKIKAYTSEAGNAFSAWRSAGISLICAIVTVIPIFAYVFLTDPTINATTKAYGNLKHEIYFTRNVSEAEADQVATALTEIRFFDEGQQESIFLDKKGNQYIISIPLIKDAWNEPEVVNYYDRLRADVQTFFSTSKVAINLCSDDVADVKKTLK